MNSVELLEHAAKVLRDHAAAAIAELAEFDHTVGSVDWDERMTELWGDPERVAIAEYAARLHPPVALALADWLEATAAELGGPLPSYLDDVDKAAVAVAIAILRKEQT